MCSRPPLAASAALALLISLGCGESVRPETHRAPVRLAVLEGNEQTDTVARTVDDSLVARLEDQQGRGVPGAEVSWSVTEGDGAVDLPVSETDADGLVRNQWILGARSGAQAVEARWSGESDAVAAFTATALPDTVVRIVVRADSSTEMVEDSAVVGDTVHYSAVAEDRYGNVNTDSGFAWSLTDPSVARLTEAGTLVADDSGSAAVLAERSGIEGRDSVFIVERPDSAKWSYSLSDYPGDFDDLPGPEVRSGLRSIWIHGGYGTPCLTTHDRISFDGTVSGSEVRLRVVWDRPDGGCQTAADEFTFEAHLLGIQPGEYHLRVELKNGISGDLPYPPVDTVLTVW